MNTEVLTLDEILENHLQNHTVPIHTTMVSACKQAIEAINRGEPDTIIELPFNVHFYSLKTHQEVQSVEAFKIAMFCHLDQFTNKTRKEWEAQSKILNPTIIN